MSGMDEIQLSLDAGLASMEIAQEKIEEGLYGKGEYKIPENMKRKIENVLGELYELTEIFRDDCGLELPKNAFPNYSLKITGI